MAEKETRTIEQETKQLIEARANVIGAMERFVKAGVHNTDAKEVFKKSVADFQNLTRLSIVKEGGADLHSIGKITEDLIADLDKVSESVYSEADKKSIEADKKEAEADKKTSEANELDKNSVFFTKLFSSKSEDIRNSGSELLNSSADIRDSSTDLRDLGTIITNAKTSLYYTKSDLSYGVSLGSDYMEKSFKETGKTPVDPSSLPNQGAVKER